MARSVLRVADQRAGIFPECCVLSGVETQRAVRLTATSWGGPRWLLGVPGFALIAGRLPRHQHVPVALPVSERVWKMWRSRDMASFATLAAGATFFGIGIATGAVGLAVFGVLVVVAAIAYRIRAHHNYWFTCTLRPGDSTIVGRTHPPKIRRGRSGVVHSNTSLSRLSSRHYSTPGVGSLTAASSTRRTRSC